MPKERSAFSMGLAESLGGRVGSDYRSVEEQQALFDRGVTRVPGGKSAHNRGTPDQPGAVDIVGIPGGNPRQVEALLRERGYKVRKVIWETGKGRNQGTAPHYHIEFEDGSTASAQNNGSQTVIPDLTTVQPTATERSAMQTPRDSVGNPFDPALTEDLRSAQQTEKERLSFADSLLQRVTSESTEIREGLEQDLAQTVEVKRAINDQTRQHLQSLAAVAEPVWQKRTQLATQLLALDEMNPLEQGIRSMFDPNFNRRHLQAEIRSQTAALGELNAVFEERYKHSQLLAQLSTMDYNDTEALANLMLQNGGEDVRLALQSFNLAGSQVDTLLGGLQADSALIAARQQARNDVLAGLTIGQINAGLASAQESPNGMTEINGIPIRAGELQEAQTRMQSQALAMANTQIAIQQGNKELENMNKTAVLETMSIADVQSAIQNDGDFNGVQLDLTQLADRLQRLQQSNQVVANQQAMETAPGLAEGLWRQVAGTHRIQAARFTSLFGQVPGELTQFNNSISIAATAFRDGLKQAKLTGTENEFMASQMPQVQALIAQQQKLVESVVTRWSGGNKDVKAVGLAWMTGQPIDSESAVKGLIHFARNGIPAGTKFTGPAAQLLRIVKEEVDSASAGASATGSPSLQDLMKPSEGVTEAERNLIRRVQQRIGEDYNASMGLELYNSVPDIAKELKLPFARISQQQWQDATANGDAEGLRSVARNLDMRPEDFEAMLVQGPDGPMWQERAKGLQGADANFSTWQDRLTVAQFSGIMRYLDANFASTGFVPSAELRRVTAHPGYMRAAQNGERGSANASFGGFLANAAGGGNFFQNAEAQAGLWTRAYQQYDSARQRTRMARITSLVNSPIERAQFILGAVPNLAPAQEQLLLREFQRVAEIPLSRAREGADAGAAASGVHVAVGDQSLMEEANRNIDAFIMGGTSDDPAVKAALAIARRGWEKYAGPLTQAAERQAQRGVR